MKVARKIDSLNVSGRDAVDIATWNLRWDHELYCLEVEIATTFEDHVFAAVRKSMHGITRAPWAATNHISHHDGQGDKNVRRELRG